MVTFDEAVEILFTERINIELLLTSDVDGYMFFNFRARPWKNSPNDGRMLIVGASSIEHAFCLLAEALMSSAWVPLDWKTRVHDMLALSQPALQPVPKLRPSEPENGQEPTSITYPYTRS